MASVHRNLLSSSQTYYAEEVQLAVSRRSPLQSSVVVLGAACFCVVALFSAVSSQAVTNLFAPSQTVPQIIVQTSRLQGVLLNRNLVVREQVLTSEAADVALEGLAIVEAKASSFNVSWKLGAALTASVVAMVHLYKRFTSDADDQCDEDMDDLVDEANWAIAATVGEAVAPSVATVAVKDASGASAGTAELALKTAGINSRHVIHRKLVAEFANRRQANAHTKTRGEVSGGGKKPYKQKGSGNARRGSNRSPLMRHGGVAFGPRNTKNYKQKINKKEGRLAISSLIQNRAPLITVIKDMENSMNVVSTKKAVQMIDSWKDSSKGDKVLLVIDAPETWPANHPLVLSTNNLEMVRLQGQRHLSVADLLWPNQIFVSEKAMEALKLRFEATEEDSEASEATAAV